MKRIDVTTTDGGDWMSFAPWPLVNRCVPSPPSISLSLSRCLSLCLSLSLSSNLIKNCSWKRTGCFFFFVISHIPPIVQGCFTLPAIVMTRFDCNPRLKPIRSASLSPARVPRIQLGGIWENIAHQLYDKAAGACLIKLECLPHASGKCDNACRLLQPVARSLIKCRIQKLGISWFYDRKYEWIGQ